MAKVNVTTKFDIAELIAKFTDTKTGNEIGETVVGEAKRMISEGQSPVRGYGRFERYKDPAKYPGNRKNQRPVNLEDTGDMLAGYDYQVLASDDTVKVGMVNGSADEKKIAGYHNEGTAPMAQRRIVPGAGEEWAVSIMRKVRDVYEKRLSQLIKQSNKK